eukprot:6667630-Lingulodinium_polyedra.AAC.1
MARYKARVRARVRARDRTPDDQDNAGQQVPSDGHASVRAWQVHLYGAGSQPECVGGNVIARPVAFEQGRR